MTARYLIGDVLEVARTLEPGSVDLIVTSPPFLAVRSYLPADHPDKDKEGGQQSTPGEYIDWLLEVVEALGPCLAPHGSLVFELGDTYAGSGGGFGGHDPKFNGGRDGTVLPPSRLANNGNGWPRAKSKSLIPELFRLALTYGLNPLTGRTTDRWILRNVITWCRPNPTPGALGDKVRPATSDIAVLTKSGKRWFDLDAERSPPLAAPQRVLTPYQRDATADSNRRSWQVDNKLSDDPTNFCHPAGAPLLDWWELPPGGYSGAHYAVWPPELVRRLISLMCPLRVCRVCGEPSRRIVDRERFVLQGGNYLDWMEGKGGGHLEPFEGHESGRSVNQDRGRHQGMVTQTTTLGWSDCGHGPDNWRDGIVLDPFAGSGTTLAVASGMGRDSIGIDLDERNLDLARERVGMFLQ